MGAVYRCQGGGFALPHTKVRRPLMAGLALGGLPLDTCPKDQHQRYVPACLQALHFAYCLLPPPRHLEHRAHRPGVTSRTKVRGSPWPLQKKYGQSRPSAAWGTGRTSSAAPTTAQQLLFAELTAKLQAQLNIWDQILRQDLTGFNKAAEKQKLTLVDVRPRQ
jgi:hypothetical protein